MSLLKRIMGDGISSTKATQRTHCIHKWQRMHLVFQIIYHRARRSLTSQHRIRAEANKDLFSLISLSELISALSRSEG